MIFVHDDVTIGDVFLQEKMTDAFGQKNYAIAGLAGTSDFKIRPDLEEITWFQPPPEAWSGAVEHHLSDGSTIMDAFGPTPKRCVVLDGLFLAVDLRKIGRVRFDEQLAFHFYDLDFLPDGPSGGPDPWNDQRICHPQVLRKLFDPSFQGSANDVPGKMERRTIPN